MGDAVIDTGVSSGAAGRPAKQALADSQLAPPPAPWGQDISRLGKRHKGWHLVGAGFHYRAALGAGDPSDEPRRRHVGASCRRASSRVGTRTSAVMEPRAYGNGLPR